MNEKNPELDKLLIGLEKAANIFNRNTHDLDREPDAKHWQREGAAEAVVAILDYLKPHSEGKIRKPLFEILGAIADADHGRPNPLTTPRKRSKSAPRKSIHESSRNALAAVTVSLMMDNGIKENQAVRKVAPLVDLKASVLGSRRDNYAAFRGNKVACNLYHKWYQEYKQDDDLERRIAACLKILQ